MDATDSQTELPVSASQGRYLCGVLYQRLGSTDPVQTGDLADRLSVSTASVTETIEQFADQGLLVYEPYRGVELTDRGEHVARRLFWRQCAVQRFFENTVGEPIDINRAYQVGYSLSTATIQAMSEYVDQPCHGQCEATTREECDLAVPVRASKV